MQRHINHYVQQEYKKDINSAVFPHNHAIAVALNESLSNEFRDYATYNRTTPSTTTEPTLYTTYIPTINTIIDISIYYIYRKYTAKVNPTLYPTINPTSTYY